MTEPNGVRLRTRLLLVSYDLIGQYGERIGGGGTRIEASNGDSMCKQLNAMLGGRRVKITEITPIT